jgi:hypothetical protein
MEASWVFSHDPENPTIMLANPLNYALRNLLGDPLVETANDASFVGLGPEDMFDEGNSMDLSPIRLNHDFGVEFQDENDGGLGDEVDDTFDYKRHLSLLGAF